MYCTKCGAPITEGAKYCSSCGMAVETTATSPAPPVISSPGTRRVEYAGFWRRFVAYIIDRLILGIPTSIMALAFIVPSIATLCNRNWHANDLPIAIASMVAGWIWLGLLIFLGYLLYFAWFESSRLQATPGKMVLGIIVTDMNGNRVTFLRALGRNLGKVISHLILNIGFIMAGITQKKQALHDMLADCLVVMKQD
jgi:uncharacterized RDD family membrane protein YckC